MHITEKVQLRPPLKPLSDKKAPAQSENSPVAKDGFQTSPQHEIAPQKPVFAKTPSAPKPAELTDNPEVEGLTGWKRAAMLGMTGVMLLGATGCINQGDGTGSSTSQNTEAMKKLNQQFKDITKSMTESGSQTTGEIAGQVFNSIAEYSRATGEKGEVLMSNLASTIRNNKKIAAAVAFAGGTAIGIGLDQLGVTDAAVETAEDVIDWVKENPIEAVLIGAAVAGAGALIYNKVIKPMAEIPEAPTGEHAESMEAVFNDLEKQLQEHQGDPGQKAAEVSKTLTAKIKEYAAQTGRSASEVRNDVMAWAYDHPIVATSLVAGAGVATGVLLSEAGVPEHVAQFAGIALDAAGDGLGSVVDYAKENPVVAGAVTAAVAAGAGYLIYQQVNSNGG